MRTQDVDLGRRTWSHIGLESQKADGVKVALRSGLEITAEGHRSEASTSTVSPYALISAGMGGIDGREPGERTGQGRAEQRK